jgi:amino acid transporter
MHSGIKLIIGILIFLVGLYWYMPGNALGNTLADLKVVFLGVFGLFLIVLGIIIAWIEYEDLKWESKEKKEKAAKAEAKKK